MTNMIALDNKAHRQLKVDVNAVAAHGADLHLVPVVVSEFQKLLVQYPIVFSKHADTGQFMCSALLGFEQGENLFWQQGAWQGVYVPAQVERQPFFLGQGQGQEPIVCVDMDSPALGDKGEALFDQDGNPTELLQQKQQLLAQLLHGESQTQAFIKALLDLELLSPISLDIRFVDNSQKTINGLYSIDEDKLKGLNGEHLAMLNEHDFLSAAYAVVHATAQIYPLIERKNQRIEQGNAWFQEAAGQ